MFKLLEWKSVQALLFINAWLNVTHVNQPANWFQGTDLTLIR